MKINKIWTVRISDDRYVHNATFVGDNTMYVLFHMVVTTTTNRREIEGMSVTGSSLYVQFAQHAELTQGRI